MGPVSKLVNRALYKPIGLGAGMLSGMVAGAIFSQVWKLVSNEDDAPGATEKEYGWGEVLAAAAIQGAIFGVVRAAVERAGAKGYQRMTGEWPGD
jgi:Protein of unknown function (DUF4235)